MGQVPWLRPLLCKRIRNLRSLWVPKVSFADDLTQVGKLARSCAKISTHGNSPYILWQNHASRRFQIKQRRDASACLSRCRFSVHARPKNRYYSGSVMAEYQLERKQMKTFVHVGLFAISVVVASGAMAQETVKVGGLFPLSGNAASAGQQ